MLRLGSIDEKHRDSQSGVINVGLESVKIDGSKEGDLLSYLPIGIWKNVMSYTFYREAGILARISPDILKEVFPGKKMEEIAPEVAIEDVEDILNKLSVLQADKKAEIEVNDRTNCFSFKVKSNLKRAVTVLSGSFLGAGIIAPGAMIFNDAKSMFSAIKNKVITNFYPFCQFPFPNYYGDPGPDGAVSIITSSYAALETASDCKGVCYGDGSAMMRYEGSRLWNLAGFCDRVMCTILCSESYDAGSKNQAGSSMMIAGGALAVTMALCSGYAIYRNGCSVLSTDERVLKLPFSAISNEEIKEAVSRMLNIEKTKLSKLLIKEVRQKLNTELSRFGKLKMQQENVCKVLEGIPVILTESEKLLYDKTLSLFPVRRERDKVEISDDVAHDNKGFVC